MRPKPFLTLALLMAAASLPAESTRWERVLRADSGVVEEVCVANISGDVVVRGSHRSDVLLRVHERTLRANSLQAAREAMPLRIESGRASVSVLVGEVPEEAHSAEKGHSGERSSSEDLVRSHRCSSGNSVRGRIPMRYDLELEVPAGASLSLGTVNDGRVVLTNAHGSLRVSNVNGDVEAREISGAGSFSTVNGGLIVTVSELPAGELRFTNVNGVIDLTLPPTARADLRIQTLNGKVWTDFPFEAHPVVETVDSHRGGRYRLQRRGETAVRIGGGGTDIRFNTVNGDIIIRDRDLR